MSYDAVIDSYAWVEYFRGTARGRKAKRYIESGACITPTIVLAELSDKYFREGYKIWERDLNFILAKTTIVELTKDIAVRAGKTKNIQRKNRPDFGMADAIIYETAKQYDTAVLTGDPHFKGLENVIYIG
ncbi:MAG: type II toxin-antitoxin system VapC family toxin [Candidatus Thermoplasmatota archaeon]|nr:type II toxin-antitoxin system VapC family toxin [Candidatus Thermoplasmatota archaeon]